jgi:hypothetical protein
MHVWYSSCSTTAECASSKSWINIPLSKTLLPVATFPRTPDRQQDFLMTTLFQREGCFLLFRLQFAYGVFTYLLAGVLSFPSEHSNTPFHHSPALQKTQPFHARSDGSREYFRALLF